MLENVAYMYKQFLIIFWPYIADSFECWVPTYILFFLFFMFFLFKLFLGNLHLKLRHLSSIDELSNTDPCNSRLTLQLGIVLITKLIFRLITMVTREPVEWPLMVPLLKLASCILAYFFRFSFYYITGNKSDLELYCWVWSHYHKLLCFKWSWRGTAVV